jgi:hypothetical protein
LAIGSLGLPLIFVQHIELEPNGRDSLEAVLKVAAIGQVEVKVDV